MIPRFILFYSVLNFIHKKHYTKCNHIWCGGHVGGHVGGNIGGHVGGHVGSHVGGGVCGGIGLVSSDYDTTAV